MELAEKKYSTADKKREISTDILVVEDDKGLNRLIQNVLQREGFVTKGATTGSEAVSRASDNPNSILLMDYMLPDITGKEIVKILDQKKLLRPFIVMTGHGDEKTAVEMMKLGARDYIVKDISLINMIPLVIKRVVRDIRREIELAEAEKAVREWQTDMSILYRISTTISQTIAMEELFNIILDTITSLEIFNVEQKAGIFLVDGDRMNLVSSRGHPETFIDSHKSMRVGDCLCGLSAKTGEVIVSRNCMKEIRHTVRYPDMAPHGHIIIPLHARGKITGVLFLYLKADTEIKEGKLKLLTSIGNQIGIAIENARLYEETREFSLRDPLTGLANRRMMHIVFDQNLERVKRFKKPFSVIMLDIDYFKSYNDEHGHASGDTLLVELARLITEETRQIDLVVRYGGEEFLILLPDTDSGMALEVAERIRNTVESNTGITVSLGVATHIRKMQKEELIKEADKALYHAKQNGRNRVETAG